MGFAALDAKAGFAVEADRALAATPATAVGAALFVLALGQADAVAEEVADETVRAGSTFAATAV